MLRLPTENTLDREEKIMAEWVECTIGDLCDTISDTYKGNDENVILVNTSDVLEGKVLNHIQVPNKNLKGQFKKTFRKNDILFSEIRPANKRFAFVDFEDTSNYIASTKLMVLRHNEKVLPEYLFAILKSNYILAELQHLAETRSGTFPQITFTSELAPMKVNLPDKKTQKQIVSILSSIEQKIDANESINDNLYEMVNAYYTSLFKDIECEMTTIGNYAERIYSGGTPTTSNAAYWGGTFGWFSSGETRNRFVISTEKSITQTGIDNSSTKLASKHDIVMASAGQGFTRGQTSMLLIDTYVNQSVIVIHADRNILPYLFWNLANRYEELRAISDSSSIRGSLTTKMIAAFEIPLANNDVIQTFSDFAWAVIPQIENNLLENERLAALRDSLLPKLMSGELDVSAVEL